MEICLVAPSSHVRLATLVAQQLGVALYTPLVKKFADGELEVTLSPGDAVVGKKVVILQSTNAPVHDNLMQLMNMIHAAARAGAAQIVVAIPYFGYARQIDGIALITKLLSAAGVHAVITISLHAPHAIDDVPLPIINLEPLDSLAHHIRRHEDLNDVCLVAPDRGARDRVELLAQKLGVSAVYCAKERVNGLARINIGSLSTNARKALVIDDMIDTGATALQVCVELRNKGFECIIGYFVHPVLSGAAVQQLQASYFERIYVSNTIELVSLPPKFEIFDIHKLLVEEIKKLI
jgi:ribose-phosphate pyrophosphokinase